MSLKWITALFFSFLAYMVVLFVIIVFSMFYYQDFNFSRTVMICVPYIIVLIIYLVIMLIIFKIKLD
jgi:hypothetical protein